ncbi:MAG: hypothetical protein NC548_62845 [Lachnospiraceae bacterium]|nr:hypothetical protein [Lachnospiraceae bacterium]
MSKHIYCFDCHYNGFENSCRLSGCQCDFNGLQNASKCKDFITEDDWIGTKGYERETKLTLTQLRTILTDLQEENQGCCMMSVDEILEQIRVRL